MLIMRLCTVLLLDLALWILVSKVLVHQKVGTVMAFQPDFLHGTTLTSNAVNKGIAICFSRCICEAWEEAKKTDGGASVIAAAGADMEVE